MASTRTEVLNTFTASTAKYQRKSVIDAFFGSNTVLAGIKKHDSLKVQGGSEIVEDFIYAGFNGGSFGRGQTFNTDVTEFVEPMHFDWKGAYAPVVVDGFDAALNQGKERVFSIVKATMENAHLTLNNDLGTQIFADGTGNSGNDIDGLGNAVSRTGTYGGVTRASTGAGAAIRAAQEDTTGGALSYGNVNTVFGNTVVANETPDLMPTTQTLRNVIWSHSQPSERASGGDDIREIGFNGVRFNGAVVVVDSHCPAGFLYFLNMKWFTLYMLTNWDFKLRGMFETHDTFTQVGQVIAILNLVCRAPRFQGVMSGLS